MTASIFPFLEGGEAEIKSIHSGIKKKKKKER